MNIFVFVMLIWFGLGCLFGILCLFFADYPFVREVTVKDHLLQLLIRIVFLVWILFLIKK